MSFRKKPKTVNPDDLDPSVFYYDEVYDDMKNKESADRERDEKSRSQERQGSKYIQGLLESAELRKTEKEIRKFKRYAQDRKEAEEEGSLDQSEVYITEAYKKKLQEISRLDKNKSVKYKDTGNQSSDSHEKSLKRNNCDDRGVNRPNSSKRSLSPSEGDVSGRFSEVQQPETETFVKKSERQLSTSEDRKHYLEEILAKRTVNDKFKEALSRYKQRKEIT